MCSGMMPLVMSVCEQLVSWMSVCLCTTGWAKSSVEWLLLCCMVSMQHGLQNWAILRWPYSTCTTIRACVREREDQRETETGINSFWHWRLLSASAWLNGMQTNTTATNMTHPMTLPRLLSWLLEIHFKCFLLGLSQATHTSAGLHLHAHVIYV